MDREELQRAADVELDAWFNSRNPLDWGSATLIKFRLAEVLGIPRKLAGELHQDWANRRKVK